MVMLLQIPAGCVALDCFPTWDFRAEMISVELWRARIGLFNCTVSCSSLSASNRSPSTVPVHAAVALRRGTRRKKSFRIRISSDPDQLQESEPSESTILPISPLTAASSLSSSSCIDSTRLFQLLDVSVVSILLIIAVICQLLMTSGDIETNPGPKHRADDKPQLADLQHLTYTTEDGRMVDLRLMNQLRPYAVRVAIALRFPQYAITAVERHDDPVYYLLSEWLRGANQKDPRPTWRTLIKALREANCQEEANELDQYLNEPNSSDTDISDTVMESMLYTTCSEHGKLERLPVFVSAEYKSDFEHLQNIFCNMFEEIRSNVQSQRITVEVLKQYLYRFPELENIPDSADTIESVMTYARKKCSLTDCSYLERIACHFDLQKAKDSISNYRKTLETFCQHTLENHSYVKSFVESCPQCISSLNQITFKLEWNAKKRTLIDIHNVLRKCFGDKAAHVKIVVIKNCSIVVLCWAPHCLMAELVRQAESNLDQLIEIGVVKLTIGFEELITEKDDTRLSGRTRTALQPQIVGGSRDSLSGKQNVVEEAVASLPSISDQLDEFTKDLTEAADETVHKIDKLKQKGINISSDGSTTCQKLKVVINNSYNYARAIDEFIWNAQRDERQKFALQEASKEENPNFGPMHDYIQHIKRFLGRAGEKHEIFHESCKGVVERLEVVSEEIQKRADEAGSKKTASQVTGGVLAGGAMAAGVGTGAAVAVTGIGLPLSSALGIGTIIGLVITAVAAPVVGLGAGIAVAVGTHFVAKHYNDRKEAFDDLARRILNLERQASQLDQVLDQIKILMDTIDDLTRDVQNYTTAPHHRKLLLDLFDELEKFNFICSKLVHAVQH